MGGWWALTTVKQAGRQSGSQVRQSKAKPKSPHAWLRSRAEAKPKADEDAIADADDDAFSCLFCFNFLDFFSPVLVSLFLLLAFSAAFFSLFEKLFSFELLPCFYCC